MGACEQPKSPDFKLDHEFEVPLTVEKTYPFLGDSEALIDTTAEDNTGLFSPDADGMVRISKDKDFHFGDLKDAIPKIDADPTTVSAEVGEIGLTNFNSGEGNVGEAGFQSITGISSPSAGQEIPAGSGTVNIDFTTDYFKSAVIKKNGDLELVLTNNLGFNIDELEVSLNSGFNFVGSAIIGTDGDKNDNFDHDTQETATIRIPASTQLSDLSADITANWDKQDMQEKGDNLVINDVGGQNLIASQVTASVESQSFMDSGTSNVDQSSFEFRQADDFVELSSGELTVDIDNNIDLAIETLNITFPDIIDASGQPLELNSGGIPASSNGGNFAKTIDLADYRIKAQNGTINYSINATTENTQQGSGSETRTINESDNLNAEVDLNNLEVSRAEGYVVPKMVMLNEDQTNDGQDNIDVFNNNEAETTDIDAISELSDRVSGLTFKNPILTTFYNTNLGVNTTIYAVIAGTDSKGNTEFLSGVDGSQHQVQSSEIPSELKVNGQTAEADQVIKFSIKTAENPDPEQGEPGSNEFNANNTSSPAFFSNLPSKIRFIGAAKVNEKQESGIIVNPIIFEPTLGLDLPLNFSADGATFKDALDADLSDLPGEEDKQNLSEATLTLNYTNGLPLGLDLLITMIDADGEEITRKEDIKMDGAEVDSNGFVTQPVNGKMDISFSEDVLKDLNKTRKMKLDMTINTTQKQSVRIKNDDAITLQIEMKTNVTSTVN